MENYEFVDEAMAIVHAVGYTNASRTIKKIKMNHEGDGVPDWER